ncbi:hypothetical protein BJY52DRAFT_1264037 [Lactarius psammicola]|nr:hypothetical protein BJY52DRAFT_1264037 [Lactarius psammicola]
MTINNANIEERSAEILRSINVDDKDTIEELGASEVVADLELSDGQILLIRMPATTPNRVNIIKNPIRSKVDQEYQVLFLHAHTKGRFTEDDFFRNQVADVNEGKVPEFVEKYEKMLGQKRRVTSDMRDTAETLVGCEEYFDYSMANVSESFPTVDRLEILHLGYISSLYRAKIWDQEKGNSRLFKEHDANWLFFYPIADHFESLPSNISSDGTSKITVKLGQERWPFSLIVKVDETYYTYKPKSDFLILKFGLPRVAVEVYSFPPGRPAVDHHRLMLQGASIVRFANTFLDAYKKKKNFVFVAIFVSGAGLVDRNILYQTEDSQKVHRRIRTFRLGIERDRVRFALELYNISSALDHESENGDTEGQVEKLATSVYYLSKDHHMSTFTGKTKHTASNDGGNQTGPRVRQKGGDGGANEQLEACGYEVEPDVFETDGGTWESVFKLPPHIRTVYRRRDPKRTELIAKHIRKGSNELYMLNYFRTTRPQSPHVISMIENIPSITGGWLILPKLHSISDQRLMNIGGIRGRVQLGLGLIKGLGYLHEHKVAHRDVKPSNLVCDDKFRLQIIDFDVAIEVEDENTEIDEYRGTKGWTAPEMGEEDGPTPMHSPIKADRWSCGRVLLGHMMIGKGDDRLSKFAGLLMGNDPQQRPSLLEWDKWSAASFSDTTNVLKDGGKESRPRKDIEVDGESMKPPDAKKPRLAVIE